VALQAFHSPPPTEDPPVLNSLSQPPVPNRLSEGMYATVTPVAPRPDTDYINPENYQYVNQLGPGRATESPGYKALDPKTIDDHTYTSTTPLSRSTASLVPDQKGTEYMEVGTGYLEILPSSVPKMSRVDSEQYSRVRSATVPINLDIDTEYVNAN